MFSQIDMNSPDSVFYLRVAYVASQLLQLAVCYFLTLKVRFPLPFKLPRAGLSSDVISQSDQV